MTPRVNANVIYGLWVIIMCQYRFINCSRCPTLVEVLIMGRTHMCETRECMEPFIPSSGTYNCCLKNCLKKIQPHMEEGLD